MICDYSERKPWAMRKTDVQDQFSPNEGELRNKAYLCESVGKTVHIWAQMCRMIALWAGEDLWTILWKAQTFPTWNPMLAV